MLHQIGIGTLGPVFRTYEPTRDRLVAVKAFRLDIVPEQAHALAAGLSRATKASLFHPSIVEPIEAGVEGTVAYRAEEYVAAESLDVAMRHYAPAPIEKVLPFITQLAGAIDFARAAGIGHGGLHPRDIFVTPDEARATGFGVVDALEQVGIRAPIRRPYSAPERIDGRAWSTQADVFSLAVITFELLTGKRPSGTGAEIGPLPDGDHAAALHAVLVRAMDEFPANRHTSALAFASAVEAASQGRRLTDAVSVVDTVAAPPAANVPVESPRVAKPEAPAPPPDPVKPETPKPAPRARKAAATPAPKPAVAPPAPDTPPPVKEPTIVAAPVPGEFGVEAALDPVHEAIADLEVPSTGAPAPIEASHRGRSAQREGTLFDDEDPAGQVTAAAPREERFGLLDDDADAKTGPSERWEASREDGPILAEREHTPAASAADDAALDGAIFHGREPRFGAPDPADPGRPAILPFAVVSVLMLLVGFAGGYYVGSRDRQVPDPAPTATAKNSPPAAASSGRATPDKAGQYSEQKVTPPAGPPATSPPAAPPPAQSASSTPAVTRPAPAPTPAAAKGQIMVRSVPSRAGVTINGTWRGRTPITLDLPFGNYLVRVVQPGYRVAREEFTLNASEPTRTYTARLEPAGPAAPAAPAAAPVVTTGTLYVDSRPRGASVFVDNKSAGQTPLTLDMNAGAHLVRIEMNGKKTVTANRRIVAGQTERVTVSLEDRQDEQGAPAAASERRR